MIVVPRRFLMQQALFFSAGLEAIYASIKTKNDITAKHGQAGRKRESSRMMSVLAESNHGE